MASKFELFRALNTLYSQLDAMARGWNTDKTSADRNESADHFASLCASVREENSVASEKLKALGLQTPYRAYEEMLRAGPASGMTGIAANLKYVALQARMKHMLGQMVEQAEKDYKSSKNKKILLGTGLAIGGAFALSRYFGGKKKKKRRR